MQQLNSSDGMPPESLNVNDLPEYLKNEFANLHDSLSAVIRVLSIDQIRALPSPSPPTVHGRQEQYAYLLLRRHHLTERMCWLSDSAQVPHAICPTLVLQRAKVYEALAYADLALADAYVAFSVAAGEEEDLRAVSIDGVPWDGDEDDRDDDEGEEDRSDTPAHDKGRYSDDEAEEDGAQDTLVMGNIEVLRAEIKRDSLRIIVRAIRELGCIGELPSWEGLLRQAEAEIKVGQRSLDGGHTFVTWTIYDGINHRVLTESGAGYESDGGAEDSMLGLSRREIYPWNEFEPRDRMSDESLKELNVMVYEASDGCLEVRKTVLPSFATPASHNNECSNDDNPASIENAQLGLFAVFDLAPSQTILQEHSVLTAIRPHDAPLCDACAADLHPSVSDGATISTFTPNALRAHACPACSIPFCSQRCLSTALSTYHLPNLENSTTDAGYPPSSSPFCPGTSAHADIHELGRAESSDEPEWDLYLLLVARCIMMAETSGLHPLAMREVKWLWGDFTPLPGLEHPSPESNPSNLGEATPGTAPSDGSRQPSSPASPHSSLKKTLPFSLPHSLLHPYAFCTTLLLSLPHTHPYSTHWLRNYDFWILQTLYAKFRGVADAKQSSWNGKPESAGVFGLWCLGNHSCAPNVEWETLGGDGGEGGGRVFRVRGEVAWREPVSRPMNGNDRAGVDGTEGGSVAEAQSETTWNGIKKGEQIWNHYTDVREDDFRVRRGRLREVLGGECMCERCVTEEKAWKVEQREDKEERRRLKMLTVESEGRTGA